VEKRLRYKAKQAICFFRLGFFLDMNDIFCMKAQTSDAFCNLVLLNNNPKTKIEGAL
jgi:hypothetical protein